MTAYNSIAQLLASSLKMLSRQGRLTCSPATRLPVQRDALAAPAAKELRSAIQPRALGMRFTGFLLVVGFTESRISGCADAIPRLGPETYHLEFATPASPEQFATLYPGLSTWGYFGDEPLKLRPSKPRLTLAERFTSRTWPGIQDVYVDPDYCPGAITPKVTSGLEIDAYRLDTQAGQAACGQGRRAWASAIVTSQPNPYGPDGKLAFAQAYGYFEVEARLPCVPGRWPAFWLLGTLTGNNTEIDVFEHYGGSIAVQSGAPLRSFVINRIGQPFSTIHFTDSAGGRKIVSNASALPKIADAERKAFCDEKHKFGVYWSPTSFQFYVDRRETFSTPNPGITDPHYWVLNMDISPSAGDPMQEPGLSAYLVYSVRAWALAPGDKIQPAATQSR